MKKFPKEIVLPDYKNCILNLSNSILKHFGVKPENETLANVDEILEKNYKHVVVILLDGLGNNILEKHLSYRDFLRRHLLCDYSSVFPATTTASTISFLSGKSPLEHGWLGWDVYFKQEDKTVTCFSNNLQGSKLPAADYSVAEKYLPFENIFEKINNGPVGKAYGVFPFDAYGFEGYSQLDDWTEAIRKNCHKNEKNFTYAYWENPDAELHIKGTDSNDVTKVVKDLNARMAYLCENCPETVFFITSDHGHIDIRNVFLQEDYADFAKMLEKRPSLEKRAISFYVKDEYKEQFEEEFNKHFSKDYFLLSKDEVRQEKLFGPGFENENLTGIGDFIAIAYGQTTILWNKTDSQFKAHHAGLSKEEVSIPLIWYENKPKHTGEILYYGFIALFVIFLLVAMM